MNKFDKFLISNIMDALSRLIDYAIFHEDNITKDFKELLLETAITICQSSSVLKHLGINFTPPESITRGARVPGATVDSDTLRSILSEMDSVKDRRVEILSDEEAKIFESFINIPETEGNVSTVITGDVGVTKMSKSLYESIKNNAGKIEEIVSDWIQNTSSVSDFLSREYEIIAKISILLEVSEYEALQLLPIFLAAYGDALS